jgi:hypothetical protein
VCPSKNSQKNSLSLQPFCHRFKEGVVKQPESEQRTLVFALPSCRLKIILTIPILSSISTNTFMLALCSLFASVCELILLYQTNKGILCSFFKSLSPLHLHCCMFSKVHLVQFYMPKQLINCLWSTQSHVCDFVSEDNAHISFLSAILLTLVSVNFTV